MKANELRAERTQPDFGAEDDPNKLFRAGLLLMQTDRVHEASAAFERALALAPGEAIFQSYHGLCLVQTGRRYQEALDLCENAIKDSPYHPELYHNLAQVYLVKGKRKKAIAALQHGLQLDPQNAAIHDEFRRIGIRKRPVLPFLHRSHPANIFLGKFLKVLHLR